MAYLFDPVARTCTVTTLDDIDPADVYEAWKNHWNDLAVSRNIIAPIRYVGNEATSPTKRRLPAYFWDDTWKFVVADSDQVRNVNGDIFPETAGTNMFVARPGRTVQIFFNRSADGRAERVEIGSGVTSQDKADIATASRDAILTDGTPYAGARIDAAISSRAAPGEGLTGAQALVLTQQLAALTETLTKVTRLWEFDGHNPAKPVIANEATKTMTCGDAVQSVVTIGDVTTRTTLP
jgi:hypothetical protein